MRTIDSTIADRRAENLLLARSLREGREDGRGTRVVRSVSTIVFFSSVVAFVVVALGAIWGVIEGDVVWRVLTSAGVLMSSSGMTLGVLKQLEPRR